HAALHHFSLKYVSIPAKKCLAQRKNFPLPVTLGVFRYTLETVAVNRRCGGEPDGSYLLAGQIVRTKKKIQCKKMQANKSGLHLLFPANIQTQRLTNLIPTYQAARTRTYVR
ncbi:MAG: hypothetical protein J6J02_09050, partial [Oscillospiraceae bacterium]|nr:hypothetical protein [Oscillospiraceae bacterium]